MIAALVAKEWIKLKWAALGLGLLSGLLGGILIYGLHAQFQAFPGTVIWQNLVERQEIYFRLFKPMGVLTGLVIAAVQFLPDIPKRGLRLLFHLPISHTTAMAVTIGSGAGLVVAICLLGLGIILLAGHLFFPPPVVTAAWQTALPWFLAAIPAYGMTAATLVEVRRIRKGAYVLIGWQVCALFFGGCGVGNFLPVMGRYTLFSSLFVLVPFIAAERFKKGVA